MVARFSRAPSGPRARRLIPCPRRSSSPSFGAWPRPCSRTPRSMPSSRQSMVSIRQDPWRNWRNCCARPSAPHPFRRLANPDAIVIGAGTVGCAAAFHLAKAGWRVCVLDASGVAAGASGAAEGIVGSVTKRKAGPVADIVRRSFAAFPTLGDELGHPIEFAPRPGLTVVHGDADAQLLQAFVKKRAREGIAIEWLDRAVSRAIEPALDDDIAGSVYTPEQGVVNPIALAHGYLAAARHLGAEIVGGSQVLSIEHSANRVTSVTTTTGKYAGALVVNAAGTNAQAIAAMADDVVAITPKRAQMLVSEALPPGSLRNTL